MQLVVPDDSKTLAGGAVEPWTQAALPGAAGRAEARGQEGEPAPGRAVAGPDRRRAPDRRGGLRRLRRRPRVLPVARAQEIQGARPRVPEPVSQLPGVPGLRRRAAAARGARRAGGRPDHRPRVGAHRAARRSASSGPLALTEKEAAVAGKVLREIERRLRFLQRRGPRVPDARSAVVDAFGRRVAAHQPGHVAGLGARGHAVRARRAVDRPAPARQPAPHRHPAAAARPGQHGAGRRARRGHDPRGRPHRGHRPRRRRAGRTRHLLGRLRGPGARAAIAHGEVPAPRAVDCRCRRSRRPGLPQKIRLHGRHRAQPEGRGHPDPAQHDHLRHRRQRLRQVHAGARRPVCGDQARQGRLGSSRRRAPVDRRPRVHHRRRAGGPDADRPHAALQPGHLPEGLRPDPRTAGD